MKRAWQWFSDLSIRHKLSLSYVFTIVLALGLSLAINTALVTRENRAQVLRSAQHVFAQSIDNLTYRTESIGNLLYALATNPSLQELFEKHGDYYLEDIGRWPIDYQAYEKMTYLADLSSDILAVRLIMDHGLASVFQNDSIIQRKEIVNEAWYQHYQAAARRVWWYGDPQHRLIHAVRSVYDSQNVVLSTGLVQFDVTLDGIDTLLTEARLTDSTIAMIVDAYGTVVDSVAPGSAPDLADLWSSVASADPDGYQHETWQSISVGGRSYLVGAASLTTADWTLVLAVPNADVLRMSMRPAKLMLLVFLLMVPLSPTLAYAVSRSTASRIRNLIGRMDTIVKGDFSATLDPENRDEVGQLTERFNFMIREVEHLVEEKYALGKEVKNLELKALQAQINPHFLYNTLDLVNWMAVRRDANEIVGVVEALSRFYRLSLSRGEDTVSLQAELEHARTYVEIQNMRYENAIGLSVRVADDLLEVPVLKLIVQPIVENAIFHGIMMTDRESGRINIDAARSGDDLRISIADDGVGMPSDRLAAILSGERTTSDYHGYGVRNIHERLVLNYGEPYGLRFESAPGEGTRVDITIPIREAPPTLAD